MNNHPARLLKLPFILMIAVLVLSNLACAITGSTPARVPTATLVPQAPAASDTPAIPGPTATPASALATVTPSPTAAAVSVAETPTRTPVPSATLRPTTTPEGFFSQDTGGFSLVYPKTWTIDDKTGTHLFLTDKGTSLMFDISSYPEQATLTAEELQKATVAGFSTDTKITFKGTSSVTLANGVKAIKLDSTVKDPKVSYFMWVVYAHDGNRGYLIYIMCIGSLSARQTLLNTVFNTVTLYPPQHLYGLPKDKTLTLVGGDPVAEEMDPALTTGAADGYVGLFYSGLVHLTPDLKIAGDLAEKWVISPDGLTYTFTLRKNLKFSTGKALTAADVKQSWERAADPKTKSTTVGTYMGDIAGLKDKVSGKASAISGVKVVDDLTLAVTLDGPKPYFLEKLAYPTSFVVDTVQASGNPDKWMFSPNSSGPYEINKTLAKEAMLLRRNPDYWKPAGIENLIFLYNDGGDSVSLFKEGTIDVAYPSTWDESVALQKADNPLHPNLVQTDLMCTSYITLNPAQAPLDDPNVRQALIMAIDRKAYNEKMTQGLSSVDNSILPPAMPGYLPTHTYPAFDAAAAKATLAKSKYAGKSLTVQFTVAGYANQESAGVALLVDMWQKNLGIKVQVEYIDPATSQQTALKKQDMQIYSYGWCADYPDPENFLDVLFHTGTDFNVGHITLPDLDALLEKARTEADPTQRIALYQQAETLLLDQGVVIPLLHHTESVLVNARVKNYVPMPMGVTYIPDLTLVQP